MGSQDRHTDELAEALGRDKQVLIDVREPHEFAAGHVKGAVNVPLGQLAEKLGRFDPNKETYVICQSGHRSASGARMLKRAGFEHAYSVKGGTRHGEGDWCASRSRHKLHTFTSHSYGANTLRGIGFPPHPWHDEGDAR